MIDTGSENPAADETSAIACLDCPARMSDLCGGLPDSKLPILGNDATHLKLDKGETLFLDQDAADHVFNVQDGTVTLYRLGPGGQRQILGFLLTGDLLGLTKNETYGVSAVASTPVHVCRWDRQKFEDFLILFPAVDKRYHVIASKAVERLSNLAYVLGQLNVEQRLAGFLVHLENRQSENGGAPGTVSLTMSRRDIADYLGLTIETVSRGLTKLKTKGLISLPEQHRVVLHDQPALLALGEGG